MKKDEHTRKDYMKKVEDIFFPNLLLPLIVFAPFASYPLLKLPYLLLFVSFDFLSSPFKSLFPLRLSKNVNPYLKKNNSERTQTGQCVFHAKTSLKIHRIRMLHLKHSTGGGGGGSGDLAGER
jgi:hypothetical protein